MNETEIPTPRTDAFFKRRIELYHHGLEPQDTMRDADFARQLERENAAMRWLIQESALVIDQLSMACSGGMQPANAKIMAIKEGSKLLTKLKPYLP
jgi:hypothetical protein